MCVCAQGSSAQVPQSSIYSCTYGAMPFVEIDDLRWSHDKIYDHFKDKVSIYETVVHLVLGHVSVDDIPPLRVVKIGHLIYSLSNRRLYTFKMLKRVKAHFGREADLFVPVVFEELKSGRSFTAKTCGKSVQLSRPITMQFAKHRRGPKRLTTAHLMELTMEPRQPSCAPPPHLLRTAPHSRPPDSEIDEMNGCLEDCMSVEAGELIRTHLGVG